MADINPVLRARDIAVKQAGETGLAVQSDTAAQVASHNSDADIYTMIGGNAALIDTVKNLGIQTTEKANTQDAINFQMDQADSAGRKRNLASTILENNDARMASLKTINQKRAINFLEDPAGWLSAQFTINNDIDAHNAALSTSNAAAEQLTKLNQLTQQAVVTNTALRQTVNDASIAASAKNVAAQSALFASDAIRKGLVANTTGVEKLMSLSTTQLSIATSAFQTQQAQEVQAQNHEIALAHLDISRQNANRELEQFNWKKAEKEESEAFGKSVADRINAGYKALGYPDTQIPHSDKIKAFLTSSKNGLPLDPQMKRAYEIGTMNSMIDPSGQSRLLAASPVEFGRVLEEARPVITPAMKYSVDLFKSAVAEAELNNKAVKDARLAKDIPAYNKAIDAAVRSAFTTAAAEVKDPSNPYYLPPMSEIVKQTPALADLSLYKKVLAPLAATGVELNTPSDVYQQGLLAVSKGDISLNTFAQDMATIYGQGQRINVAAKQMENMGIVPSMGYNVKVGVVAKGVLDVARAGDITRRAMQDMAGVRWNANPGNPRGSVGTLFSGDPLSSFPPGTSATEIEARNAYYRQLGMKP